MNIEIAQFKQMIHARSNLASVCHSVISLLGLGLIFVVYPRALAAMPLGHFFSALFFLMIVFLGISSLVCTSHAKMVTWVLATDFMVIIDG